MEIKYCPVKFIYPPAFSCFLKRESGIPAAAEIAACIRRIEFNRRAQRTKKLRVTCYSGIYNIEID